jgi:hypothetical protein
MGGCTLSTKQHVVSGLERLLEVTEGLEKMEREAFEQPIAVGKFSRAGIISHLMYWDYFLIQVAIPDIYRKGEIVFPDHDDKNELASIYAKLVSKELLLAEFKEVREKLMRLVENLPANFLKKEIKVNGITHCPRTNQPYTLEYTLKEFIQHDDHHAKQLSK